MILYIRSINKLLGEVFEKKESECVNDKNLPFGPVEVLHLPRSGLFVDN